MAKYHYKVDYLSSFVTQAEIANGKGGVKIAQQMEAKINEYSAQGYELYDQTSVNVAIKLGCLEALLGKKTEYLPIITTVFRKEL